MANQLGNFNVPHFAATALALLLDNFPTIRRTNRTYDGERRAFGKGDVVNIRRPSRVSVDDAPIPAANVPDLATESVAINLNKHKEAKIKVTDRELSYTGEALIREHVVPAVNECGKFIETDMLSLSALFPHCQAITAASADHKSFTTADKIMAENGVPDTDRHYVACPRSWQQWQGLAAFSQQQGAGDVGITAQQTGIIGPKYGFSPYRSNNLLKVGAETSPTITTGTVDGNHSKGATSVAVTGATLTGTFKRGMVVQIGTAASTAGKAYNDQLYSITADVTASGNDAVLQISPPLRADVATGVTFTQKVNASAAAFETELAYHRDALALVVAPLPTQDLRSMGVDASTVTDPETGVSLRMRLFYDANAMTHFMSLDVLYGLQVLNADMGVRGIVV